LGIFGKSPIKKKTFFVSKSEISNMSSECKYWIKGFLSGNQPEPPCDNEGDVNFESKEYKGRVNKIDDFEKTGY
jgi:hypothetical protein